MTASTDAVGAIEPDGPSCRRNLWWQPGDGRRLLTLLGVSVVLAALLTWLLPYVGPPLYTGPLDWDGSRPIAMQATEPAWSSGMPSQVGKAFTDGLDVLSLPKGSDQTAVVESVEPVGLDPGISFLGARLGSPERAETWQVIRQWPPRGPAHRMVPLSTPIDAAPKGWELYLGFQVTRPGYFVSDGWLVTYEVGGRTYRYQLPSQLVVCGRAVMPKDPHCPFPRD
jgi:hypothetical protein